MQINMISSIKNNLDNMQKSIKENIDSFMDYKSEMQQQLDELKDSLAEIEICISIEEEKIEDEENIFLLNPTQQKCDSEQLESLEIRRDNLNGLISETNGKIESYNKTNTFLFQLSDIVADTLNKLNSVDKNIKDMNNEKEKSKNELLEKIELCQNLVNVDQNRCRMELEKLAQLCESK